MTSICSSVYCISSTLDLEAPNSFHFRSLITTENLNRGLHKQPHPRQDIVRRPVASNAPCAKLRFNGVGKVRNTINQPQLKSLAARPVLAREQVSVAEVDFLTAAVLYFRDELIVDVVQDGLSVRNCLLVLRLERIQLDFLFTCSVDPTLYTDFFNQLRGTEGRHPNTNGPHNGCRLCVDLVCRHGNQVSTGRNGLLTNDNHTFFRALFQPLDPLTNQVGLDRCTPG